jgi:heat shock protein HslJ
MRFKKIRFMALAVLLVAACHQGAGDTSNPAPAPAIEGVEWKLVELNGKPAGKGADGQPATLTLTPAGTRANGYAGCNRFFGSYTLAGSALKFGLLGMTRMACPGSDTLETSYTKALAATTSQRLTKGKLELLAGSVVVARFEK